MERCTLAHVKRNAGDNHGTIRFSSDPKLTCQQTAVFWLYPRASQPTRWAICPTCVLVLQADGLNPKLEHIEPLKEKKESRQCIKGYKRHNEDKLLRICKRCGMVLGKCWIIETSMLLSEVAAKCLPAGFALLYETSSFMRLPLIQLIDQDGANVLDNQGRRIFCGNILVFKDGKPQTQLQSAGIFHVYENEELSIAAIAERLGDTCAAILAAQREQGDILTPEQIRQEQQLESGGCPACGGIVHLEGDCPKSASENITAP